MITDYIPEESIPHIFAIIIVLTIGCMLIEYHEYKQQQEEEDNDENSYH